MLGSPGGWGSVDDAESLRALDAAFASGVNFFDTAANYGAGHSEAILGQAIKGRRDKAVIATKFGYRVNERERTVETYGPDEETSDVASRIEADLEASLRRLGTDYLDLYQLHVWGLSLDRALEARDVLEKLVGRGKIRAYGWSTDRADAQRIFCQGEHCAAVQQQLSVLDGNAELLEFCEGHGLASLNRSPLAMGLLSGKFSPDSRFADDDMRKRAAWHPAFKDGKPSQGMAGRAGFDTAYPDERRPDARARRLGRHMGAQPRGHSPSRLQDREASRGKLPRHGIRALERREHVADRRPPGRIYPIMIFDRRILIRKRSLHGHSDIDRSAAQHTQIPGQARAGRDG